MSERGFIRVRAADGSYPFEEFSIDSTETLYFGLTELVDGVETAVDLSAAALSVRFRAATLTGTGTPPIDVACTKLTSTGDTIAGEGGEVSAVVTPRSADFADEDVLRCGVYLVNSGVSDTLTLTGYRETLWRGPWRARIRKAIDQ